MYSYRPNNTEAAVNLDMIPCKTSAFTKKMRGEERWFMALFATIKIAKAGVYRTRYRYRISYEPRASAIGRYVRGTITYETCSFPMSEYPFPGIIGLQMYLDALPERSCALHKGGICKILHIQNIILQNSSMQLDAEIFHRLMDCILCVAKYLLKNTSFTGRKVRQAIKEITQLNRKAPKLTKTDKRTTLKEVISWLDERETQIKSSRQDMIDKYKQLEDRLEKTFHHCHLDQGGHICLLGRVQATLDLIHLSKDLIKLEIDFDDTIHLRIHIENEMNALEMVYKEDLKRTKDVTLNIYQRENSSDKAPPRCPESFETNSGHNGTQENTFSDRSCMSITRTDTCPALTRNVQVVDADLCNIDNTTHTGMIYLPLNNSKRPISLISTYSVLITGLPDCRYQSKFKTSIDGTQLSISSHQDMANGDTLSNDIEWFNVEEVSVALGLWPRYIMTENCKLLSLFAPCRNVYSEMVVPDLNHLFTYALHLKSLNPMRIFYALQNRLTHLSLEYKTKKQSFQTVNAFLLCSLLHKYFYLYNFDDDFTTKLTEYKYDMKSQTAEVVTLHDAKTDGQYTTREKNDNSQILQDLECHEAEPARADATISLSSNSGREITSTPVCKQIYGTVCLKTKQTVHTNDLITQTDSANEFENDDKKETDIIKQTIKGNDGLVNANHTIIVAPASRKQSGKKKKVDRNADTRNISASNDTVQGTDQNERHGACSGTNERSENSSGESNSAKSSCHSSSSTGLMVDTTPSTEIRENFSLPVNGLMMNHTEERSALQRSDSNIPGDTYKPTNDSPSTGHITQFEVESKGATSKKSVSDFDCDSAEIGKYPNNKQRLRQMTSVPDNNRVPYEAVVAHATGTIQRDGAVRFETESLTACRREHNMTRNIGSTPENDNATDRQYSDINTQVEPTRDAPSTSQLPNPEVDRSAIQRFEPLINIIDKISDGEQVPPKITMRYEMLRFCTLRSYPKDNKPFITRLAQAGFYYANSGDEVVCYTCARRKRNWQLNDIPMDVHRQLNPNCKFLISNSEVNVPIKTDIRAFESLTRLRTRSNSNLQSSTAQQTALNTNRTDVRSPGNTSENYVQHSSQLIQNSSTQSTAERNAQRHAYAATSERSCASDDTRLGQTRANGNLLQSRVSIQRNTGRQQPLTTSSRAFETLNTESGRSNTHPSGEGSTQPQLPKYPTYSHKIVRVTSFVNCNDPVLSDDRLADAGFFFVGFGDCVRCFHCGIGLRHWSANDDPWVEHSRWSRDCVYVRQMKGQEFVNLVQLAVQYSQNQTNQQSNNQRSSSGASESNQGPNGGDGIENLLHTDSAQSVLEMGYHPDLIRRAITRLLADSGHQRVTAANIMTKIFEIEEEDNPESEVQNEDRRMTPQSNVPSSQRTEPSASEKKIRSEDQSSQRQVDTQQQGACGGPDIATLDNKEAAAKTSLEKSSISAASGKIESTRKPKKYQILEHRKLQEENKKLKEESKCSICKDKDVCIVFLPCGHLITCETCAPTVRYCSVETCGNYIKVHRKYIRRQKELEVCKYVVHKRIRGRQKDLFGEWCKLSQLKKVPTTV